MQRKSFKREFNTKLYLIVLVLSATKIAAAAESIAPEDPDSGSELWFVSNSLGMELEKLDDSAAKLAWTLSRELRPALEIRTLFYNGLETKRWELVLAAGTAISERYYEASALREERFFNESGRVYLIDVYAGNSIINKYLYAYSSRGISSIETLDAVGATEERRFYKLRADGSLIRLQVQKFAEGLINYDSLVIDLPLAHLSASTETYRVELFTPDGILYRSALFRDAKLVSQVNLSFLPQGTISQKEELFSQTKRRNVYVYDSLGLLVRKSLYVDDILEKLYTYEYDEYRRLISENISGGLVSKENYYKYENAGTELIQSISFYENGILVKNRLYTSRKDYEEEIFIDGINIATLYFKDKIKVSEKLIDSAELIQELE